MNFLNSIFYKSLVALYKLNIDGNGQSKSFIVNAIWQALLVGKDGLNEAKLEMALASANGSWLDYWGGFYGVPREYQEEDDSYRKRIIEEILAPKNTKSAIQEATSRYVNRQAKDYQLPPNQVEIFEPWTQLLKLDSRGYIDGDGRLISYDYWNYGVIDVTIPEASFITPELINYLKKIKAAGVQIIFSLSPNWDIAVDSDKDDKNFSVYRNIEHDYYMFAEEKLNAFMLRLDGANGKQEYEDLGHLIDKTGYIDGSTNVLWEGVNRKYKPVYATGVLRNHLGSSVINLIDYFDVLNKSELTIEEALLLDDESIDALDRLNEGRLTYRLGNLDINKVSLINISSAYIRYDNLKESDNNFIFDTDNISKYLEISKVSDCSISELNDLLLDNTIKTNSTNIIKTEILNQIEETNVNASKTMPLLIKTEKLGV